MDIPKIKMKAYALKNAIAHEGNANSGSVLSSLFNEGLEKNKVKGVPAKELLTNIVSLIRFSTGLSDVLEPFTELVNSRFENWQIGRASCRERV